MDPTVGGRGIDGEARVAGKSRADPSMLERVNESRGEILPTIRKKTSSTPLTERACTRA